MLLWTILLIVEMAHDTADQIFIVHRRKLKSTGSCEYYVLLRISRIRFSCYRGLFFHPLKRAQGGPHEALPGRDERNSNR